MSGKSLMIGFLAFFAIFGAALWYFQVYAYYETRTGATAVEIGDVTVPVSNFQRIDAKTSPLKMRSCFEVAPADLPQLTLATKATPLVAPFWFECFDTETLTNDLAQGRAQAVFAPMDEVAGFDTILAFYPDGRTFVWRQLNEKYAE